MLLVSGKPEAPAYVDALCAWVVPDVLPNLSNPQEQERATPGNSGMYPLRVSPQHSFSELVGFR